MSQFNLVLSPGQRSSFNSPLTSLHLQPPSNSSNVNLTGTLVDILRSPVSSGDIAFVNCSGGNQYTLPNLNGSAAVLLYSTELQECLLPQNQTDITTNVFTVLSNVTSQSILNMEMNANLTAQISSDHPTKGSSDAENPSGSSSNYTVAQPTAMIALYSVAGVVLVLFFAVLIVGGIRAKRHPERYGVRSRPNTGPPRIRARGVAAAVLDTVSSVRYFGGQKKEEPSKEVEMEEGHAAANTEMQGEKPVESREEGDGPHGIEETMSTCPICCDDFQEGQEVRTLPCHHIFHPHCVDPWLLNLSGVCPMCRISLAPDADPEGENETAPGVTVASTAATTNASTAQPASRRESANVFSRYLDVLNNRNIATDQDRADAVRQLGTGAPGTIDPSLAPPVSSSNRRMGNVRTFFQRRAANLNNPLPNRRSRNLS